MPPLHPVVVHAPMAILPLGLLLEITAVLVKRNEFSRVGWWVQVIGTTGLFAATLTGLAAQSAITAPQEYLLTALDSHRTQAFLTDVCFAVLLFWRVGTRAAIPPTQIRWYLLTYGVGVALLFSTGLFGGELVYRYGVGVFR